MLHQVTMMATIALARLASAQCEDWLPVPVPSTISQLAVHSWASVDHDGPGSIPEYLYAAGTADAPGTPYGIVYRWDRVRWEHVPFASPGENVACLVGMPAPPGSVATHVLIGAGGFTSPDGLIRKIMATDGHTLMPVGPSTPADFFPSNCSARSLTLWDPDGDGPEIARLVAGGSFTRWGGAEATNIAMWDGEVWSALGAGIPTTVTHVSTFDFDGPGPQPPSLVALAGSPSTVRVWDGSQFTPLGNAVTNCIAAHDPDGAGPLPVQLHASGVPLLRFEDDTWVPVQSSWPAGYSIGVAAMVSLDPDGGGQLPAELVAVGLFTTESDNRGKTVAVLRDGAWEFPPGNPFDEYLWSPADTHKGLRSATLFDPDGSGPRRDEVLFGGYATAHAAPLSAMCKYVGCWNGDDFAAPGNELIRSGSQFAAPTQRIFGFQKFDEDGSGPMLPRLFACGNFRFAGGHVANGLGVWEQGVWRGLGNTQGDLLDIRRLITHDPDGAGPQRPWLVGARPAFVSGGGDVVRWDGVRWVPVGSLPDCDVFGVASFDDDAAGPGAPRIFVVGSSTISNATVFDGENWVSAGEPRTDPLVSLIVHDFDHDGPAAASLFAVGFHGVFRWSGTDWTPIGGSVTLGNPTASITGVRPTATSWDSDGDGPAVNELVIGSDSITTPNGLFRGAAAFNGASWRGLASSSPGVVYTVTTFDSDAGGPSPPCVAVGVRNSASELVSALLIAGQWHEIPAGPYALFGYDPGVDGPGPGELFIGGEFSSAGGQPTRSFARWRTSDPVAVTSQPTPQSIRPNHDAVFSTTASGTSPLFQWQRNGQPIEDGPGGASPGGGTVAGARASVLYLHNTQCTDAGLFDCVVSNACNQTTTHVSPLSITPCECDPDVNCDFMYDGIDVEAQERAVGGDLTDYCRVNPDFNLDIALDGFDVEAVELVVGGGPCP